MFDIKAICDDISSNTGDTFSIHSYSAVGGGDVNQAYRLKGKCGQEYFLKLNSAGQLSMFAAEAEGLAELAQANVIRIPTPICYGETATHAYIVIEYISFSAASALSGARMGQQLALLHQTNSNGRGYGWHRNNTIGATPQQNSWTKDWVEFLRLYRLGYQLELASKRGASKGLLEKGHFLLNELNFYFEQYKPEASLLHGDLWSGNAAFDESGHPVIYDPAVYFGDRETDIAMTELFGGFSQDFYTAYEQIWPLDAGYSRRRDIYKLYHILNHFNMFGTGYGSQASNIVDKLLIYLP